MASAGIPGVVVDKFYHKKKLCSIILLTVDKSLEIGFYRTILPFILTIRLRIESNDQPPLNV